MAQAQLTEIDAINKLLAVIGEQPIQSLDDPLPVDAAAAQRQVAETSREIQMEGWHFNSEKDWTFSPGDDNKVVLPENTIRMDRAQSLDSADSDLVLRGRTIYDRVAKTDEFTSDLVVSIVVMLDWNDIPPTAQHYIAVKAARIYQDRYLTDRALHQYTAQDEARARAAFANEDGQNADYNIHNAGPSAGNKHRWKRPFRQ